MSRIASRIAEARVGTRPDVADRARRGLVAWAEAEAAQGTSPDLVLDRLADGTAAQGLGRLALSASPVPQGLACASGCAFCCILSGADGGTITEAEARDLHAALSPLAGQADGRAWHPRACPALDPQTRACRAYDARPVICRAYVSVDVTACEQVAGGEAVEGPGTLGPYHTYLAALGLSRSALKGTRRVSTHSLARLAAAAVEGQTLDEALKVSRHKPGELDEELRRSKRDLGRAAGPGLP
ncbi:YkgJ family cysteine cluster protein [Thetidibacter halocola]|uniref:YkgJ family cysteine cluster protein n=1 Tax=Thetidibacter halocola TaxID=2827239 RepID=A0A8J7WHH7_9RHOB|nr:YkgJ family cysteine cluster protein [Thetidibacter halocola]MBS0125751.1 YkgJ family cysteine cluster protein [Thetidibacter halocola]